MKTWKADRMNQVPMMKETCDGKNEEELQIHMGNEHKVLSETLFYFILRIILQN